MDRNRKRKRVDATGRSQKWSKFAALPYDVLQSPAYRSLSPNARALLVEIVMIFNGENNGSLYLSVDDGCARIGLVDSTAATHAFDELRDMGFIAMTQDAYFHVKAAERSRARTWRITWRSCNGKAPTYDYRTKEPQPGTRARKRMERGLRTLKKYSKNQSQHRLPVVETPMLPVPAPAEALEPVSECNTAETSKH